MFFSKKKNVFFPIKVLQIVPRYFVIFVTLFSRICVVYSSGLLMVGERYGNLGSSDYYKKILSSVVVGWGFNNKHFILTGLEAEKSKVKAQADRVSGEDLPPGS